MDLISINPYNEVYVKVLCDEGIAQELKSYFSFRTPNYKYHPKYKAGVWDGFIYLFNSRSRLIYKGLIYKILEFAKSRDYKAIIDDSLKDVKKVPRENIESFIDSLETGLTPRYYQVDTVHHAAQIPRAVFLSATSSGKSFSIYSLYRYINKKTLLIVPTLTLLKQMFSDFKDYKYDAENNVHLLFSGQDKTSEKSLVISTYQSAEKLPKEWFNQFDCVIVDEVHHAKAKTFKYIMESLVNCKYRYGFTGTLDGELTHKLVIEGLFGPVIDIINTSDMQEQGFASALDIIIFKLGYSEEHRKLVKGYTYQKEKNFVLANIRRKKFINKLADSLDGVTLVLFQEVEKYGKLLFDDLKGKSRHEMFLVTGAVSGDEREEIRKLVMSNENALIYASYGAFSTGSNVPNISNIILATPTKARIKLLQSIGRGLRLHDSKDKCTVFDIADDIGWKKKHNYGMKHLRERMKIYISEGFNYKIKNLELY